MEEYSDRNCPISDSSFGATSSTRKVKLGMGNGSRGGGDRDKDGWMKYGGVPVSV